MSSAMDIDPKVEESQLALPESNIASEPNLAVLNAIDQYKRENPGAFQDPDWLTPREILVLLQILLKVVQNSSMNGDDCANYLAQHRAFKLEILDAYMKREFDQLMSHPDMPLQPIQSTMSSSSSDPNLKVAFEEPYKGDTAVLFISTLNKFRLRYYVGRSAANRPYNWSLAVIQSSGMGKSRMVDESSLTMFTIPINMREEPPPGKKAYPPPDRAVRQFFKNCQNKTDPEQQVAYAMFLNVLFAEALKVVQIQFPGLTGEDLALAWAMYLKVGEAEEHVGENRKNFYSDVVNETNRMLLPSNQPTPSDLEKSLKQSCESLERRVEIERSDEGNAFFVYFDEAHSLTEFPAPSDEHERSPYHNLGTVLSKLILHRAFFIFLSTNSCLEGFAPPAANYPSSRVNVNSRLIPPFTELPFDLYEHEALTNCHALTLETVCQTKFMVGFGRVLWYAELKIRPQNNIYEFAIDKLTACGVPDDSGDSPLAALGVRIGITFDKTNHASHPLESRLVESHLRVVYAIPEHRHFMHTGSPSEPILAEAASRYLNAPGKPDITTEGPKWLSTQVEKGFLARGERGELAGRLLVTCAHDLALNDKVKPASFEPQYHRPVPVLDFLRALFHEDHHKLILQAMPVLDRIVAGQSTASPLGSAFSESYVFFSHFVLAEDSEMLDIFSLATALVRGMAIQAKDGQESIDAVIPIHMGPLTSPILAESTSAINLQFKNRKMATDCHVNRSITVPDEEMPVISIIFEFGATETRPQPVTITSTSNQGLKPHRDDCHYQIVAYGCNSKVFGAIPLEVEEKYKAILGARPILEDFPRNKDKENRKALLAMKPAFSGVRQKEFYSEFLKTNNVFTRRLLDTGA
ncbi:unnamed protein product [Rhizoctonia solani]|uniref:Uncharacterized protein n=1 Tax=Rhizoctonia solani TaxID=456999 RepID=A0A8H2XJ03_9AGAM|nr:unnamed protein product [Rhizoctonia solani]